MTMLCGVTWIFCKLGIQSFTHELFFCINKTGTLVIIIFKLCVNDLIIGASEITAVRSIKNTLAEMGETEY